MKQQTSTHIDKKQNKHEKHTRFNTHEIIPSHMVHALPGSSTSSSVGALEDTWKAR
jgi:hypothetical protein